MNKNVKTSISKALDVSCYSDNFLTLEIFFGKLISQRVTQMEAYDGFAFFCKLFRRLWRS